jgi:hypothetical protein
MDLLNRFSQPRVEQRISRSLPLDFTTSRQPTMRCKRQPLLLPPPHLGFGQAGRQEVRLLLIVTFEADTIPQSERRVRDDRLKAGSKFAKGKILAPNDATTSID